MDYDERAELEYCIDVLRDYDSDQLAMKVYDAFIRLMEINRFDNIDLWNELKEVITSNKELSSPVVSSNIDAEICNKYLKEGHWWFNRKMWGKGTKIEN